MPVPYEGPPDERSGLAMFLDEQRAALLRKLDGLSQEQATSRSTVSELCMLTLVKHVAFVERRWFQLEEGDTVESIRALYEGIIAENRAILAAVTDLDSRSETDLNRRWVLLHLIEEVARHAGQADIIRESIDGATGG
jgi:hypothetical protein